MPGSNSSFKYSSSDPDCWWTSTNCLTPKLPGLPPDIADVPEVLVLMNPQEHVIDLPRHISLTLWGTDLMTDRTVLITPFTIFLQAKTRKPVSLPNLVNLSLLMCLKAMFFIGSNIMDWPLEAQRALADGKLHHCTKGRFTDVGSRA